MNPQRRAVEEARAEAERKRVVRAFLEVLAASVLIAIIVGLVLTATGVIF